MQQAGMPSFPIDLLGEMSSNVIVSLPTHMSVVRTRSRGLAGSPCSSRRPWVSNADTLLIGNGGGVKWYAPNGPLGAAGTIAFRLVLMLTAAPHRMSCGLEVSRNALRRRFDAMCGNAQVRRRCWS